MPSRVAMRKLTFFSAQHGKVWDFHLQKSFTTKINKPTFFTFCWGVNYRLPQELQKKNSLPWVSTSDQHHYSCHVDRFPPCRWMNPRWTSRCRWVGVIWQGSLNETHIAWHILGDRLVPWTAPLSWSWDFTCNNVGPTKSFTFSRGPKGCHDWGNQIIHWIYPPFQQQSPTEFLHFL